MNALVSNALSLVKMQYEIDSLRDYLINCPIDVVDFGVKLERLNNLKNEMENFKQSLNS